MNNFTISIIVLYVVFGILITVSGRSITEEEGKHEVESGQLGEASSTVGLSGDANAVCTCKNGYCEEENGQVVCRCRPGWGLVPPTFPNEESCEKCNCGEDFNCTFTTLWNIPKKVKCLCPEGYDEVEGVCKVPCVAESDCRNGGKCNEAGSSKACSCPEGTEGSFCETVPSCESMDCGTEAECVYSASLKGGECRCNEATLVFDKTDKKCKNSSDDRCDDIIPECHQTKGVCVVEGGKVSCVCSGDAEFLNGIGCHVCTCKNGYCEEKKGQVVCRCRPGWGLVPPISPHEESCEKCNCGEDFNCIFTTLWNIPKKVKCLCPEGYGEVKGVCKDPCSDNPCLNGGACYVKERSFYCICQDPFIGKTCDTESCTSNPCKNGGVCKVEDKIEKCFCKEPYYGRLCDSRTEINGTVILLSVLLSVFVVVLVFVACILCRSVHLLKSS